MFRTIKRAIKKVFKFITPRPLWKMLSTLYNLRDYMTDVQNSLDNIQRAVDLARHEASGQISFIYTQLSSLPVDEVSYHGVDVSEIPLKIPFFIPEFPRGIIADVVAHAGQFYEQDLLEDVDPYIPKDAVIFDIGANVGNHTLYWGLIRKASRIFSFEPTKTAFSALQKNIQLNNLEDRVTALNIGLGSQKQEAEIAFAPFGGSAATQLKYPTRESPAQDSARQGIVPIDTLDNITKEINPPLGRIDFIKIDVEGFELYVLQGGLETLKKYKPTLLLEVWKDNFIQTNGILESIGYKLHKECAHSSFLYLFPNR